MTGFPRYSKEAAKLPQSAARERTLRTSAPGSQATQIRQWLEFEHDDSRRVLPHYPLLSQLDDISGDAAYQSTEIEALLAECMRADKLVTDSAAVRGLDKLIRIARWAQKTNRGIYFVGK